MININMVLAITDKFWKEIQKPQYIDEYKTVRGPAREATQDRRLCHVPSVSPAVRTVVCQTPQRSQTQEDHFMKSSAAGAAAATNAHHRKWCWGGQPETSFSPLPWWPSYLLICVTIPPMSIIESVFLSHLSLCLSQVPSDLNFNYFIQLSWGITDI